VELSHDAGVVTDAGVALFGRIGIDVTSFSAAAARLLASFADPALIGANENRTWLAPSQRRCAHAAWKKAGYGALKAARRHCYGQGTTRLCEAIGVRFGGQ